MPTNSGDRVVRRRAADIPPTSPERLAEIRAIPDEAIDTSDIPELPGGRRIRRDPDGRMPARRSAIREAIVSAMSSRDMTAYALWKSARAYCPTLTETAVGEFLKGKRAIGLEYLEALLEAANLIVTRDPRSAPAKDFRHAIREVDRDDGFWVHLASREGRACSWKRYRELPRGRWGDEVIDEGVSDLYDPDDFPYSRFPWVVRLSRHGNTGELMIGGGGVNDFWAQVVSHEGRAFSWQRIEPAEAGRWTVIGDGGSLDAYEANGRLPESFPWAVALYPRDVEGEFMFSV